MYIYLFLLPGPALLEVEEAEAVDDSDHGVVQPLLQLTAGTTHSNQFS